MPSKRQVPEYTSAVSGVGMFGLGGTHGSPVSSKKSERRHPDIVTISSSHRARRQELRR